MKKKPYPVMKVTGGLDVSVDPIYLVDKASPSLNNIRFHQGLLKKDLGWVELGSNLPLDGVVMWLDVFKTSVGQFYFVVCTLETFYSMAGSTFTADINEVFTGDRTDLFEGVHAVASDGSDVYIITNGNDAVMTWDSATGLAEISDLSSAGITGKHLAVFKNHVLLANTTETSTDVPYRVRWDVIGDPSDWTGVGSGFYDIYDTTGGITRMLMLKDRLIIIKTDSVWELLHVGGDKIFDLVMLHATIGSFSPKACVTLGDRIVIAGGDTIYVYDGTTFDPLPGEPIYNLLYPMDTVQVNPALWHQAYGVYVKQLREYWLAATMLDNTVTTFKYNFVEKSWTRRDNTGVTAFGMYEQGEREPWSDWADAWEDESGMWLENPVRGGALLTVKGDADGYVWQDPRTETTTELLVFDTKDWLFGHGSRIMDFRIQAKGGPFRVYTSVDKGDTWVDQGEYPATDDFYEHIVELNITVQTIRCRVTSYATTLEVEWIEPWYIERQRSRIF